MVPAHTAVNTTERTLNTIIMDEEDLEKTQKIDEPATRLFKKGVVVDK